MKLIILYGAPAVGKLAVGKELEKITGYKLFHNHLSLDMVEGIFTSKDKIFWPLVQKFRLEMIDAAAKEKVKGVIFTSGYSGQPKDETLEGMIKIVKKYGGKTYFVHLVCSREEMFRRVKSTDRKKHLKTTTIARLKKLLPHWDMDKEIPFKEENIRIDNTKISAKNVANMIKKQYRL
jgi:hypothetical protein